VECEAANRSSVGYFTLTEAPLDVPRKLELPEYFARSAWLPIAIDFSVNLATPAVAAFTVLGLADRFQKSRPPDGEDDPVRFIITRKVAQKQPPADR
jgi:hypothetical protein